MKIDNPTGDPDCHKPQFEVRFEERQVEDLKFTTDFNAFDRARQVSETNEALYSVFVSPWVLASTNPWAAETLKWLHPMRTSRYLFSERFNPWMHLVATFAAVVEQGRQPLPYGHPFMRAEEDVFDQISDAIERIRRQRDTSAERVFDALYGQAPLGLNLSRMEG